MLKKWIKAQYLIEPYVIKIQLETKCSGGLRSPLTWEVLHKSVHSRILKNTKIRYLCFNILYRLTSHTILFRKFSFSCAYGLHILKSGFTNSTQEKKQIIVNWSMSWMSIYWSRLLEKRSCRKTNNLYFSIGCEINFHIIPT